MAHSDRTIHGMVDLKPSCRMKSVNYEILHILYTLVDLDRNRIPGQPATLTITSLNDSKHMEGSKHYVDQACDLRTKTFKPDVLKAFIAKLQYELGPNYTVLYEGEGTPNEHLHIQVRKAA